MGRLAAWTRPVWARARRDVRRHWPATVGLALLVALCGGVVLAALAGARRTDSSVSRFLRYYRPEDLYVAAPDAATARAVSQLPQVSVATNAPFTFLSATADGSDQRIAPFTALDPAAFRDVRRLLIVDGVLPPPTAPFDAVISEITAHNRNLRVGSQFTLFAYTADQVQEGYVSGGGQLGRPEGPSFTFRVAGISRAPQDIRPLAPGQDVVYETQEAVYLTPAFLSMYADALGISEDDIPGAEGRAIRLRHGLDDFAAFAAAARPLVGPDGLIVSGSDAAIAASGARDAVRVQALALRAFAGVALLTLGLIIGQVIGRRVALDAVDDVTLRGLGMTKAQLVATAVVRYAAVAVGGAATAVALAVALSPAFPVGLAGKAEIDPGLSVDVPVLALGAAATIVLVLARAALAAARTDVVRAAKRTERPSRLAQAMTSAGLPAPVTAGVRMSLETGAGRTAVPTRGAMVASITAVAGVVAALTFGFSLDHLVRDPHLQGWNWDVLVGNPNSPGSPDEMIRTLRADPEVGGATGLAPFEDLRIDGRSVPALALEDVKAHVFPTVVEGRPPEAADEIALGSGTLRTLHRSVGDRVHVTAGGREVTMRISGRIVVPTAGDVFGGTTSNGATLAADAADALGGDIAPAHVFAVRYAPGADKRAAFDDLQHEFGQVVMTHVTAPPVDNLRRVAGLPYSLAALLVVVGGAAMGHALVTSIRRRRRDLAVLKAVGFVRRQVAGTVFWQATTLAVVAVVVGLPVGLALGRWAWTAVAQSIGTESSPVLPLLPALLIAPVTIAVANALAAPAGWAAARSQPALALRAE